MINALLTEAWCESLVTYPQLFVGYSGGLDSTVLLHALAQVPQLVNKIRAIHVNHGISPHATSWQSHCQAYCKQLAIPLTVTQVEVEQRWNVEEHARQARYQAFFSKLTPNDCLLLAHHADDQAETVLLQLFRGAGIDGLAAMPTINSVPQGAVIRPFLHHYKSSLLSYAKVHGLKWIEDESNQDSAYSRNYLRQTIIPLLRSKWPGVVGNLVRSAQHCQQAQANLQKLAEQDCAALTNQANQLQLADSLLQSGRDSLTNVLRVWLKKNKVKQPSSAILSKIIDEVITARADAIPQVAWGDYLIRRYRDRLFLLPRSSAKKALLQPIDWTDFPKPLLLGHANEQDYSLQATVAEKGIYIPHHSSVRIAYRQGSASFYWHGQHKQLKKLFQQWQVVPWERDTIPLVYINDCLAQVVGYAISDSFYPCAVSMQSLTAKRFELDRIYQIELRKSASPS